MENNQILSIAYPIGSIYMSVNSTNPKEFFGGTWEALEDRFLIGASSKYLAETTGGEETHKLTNNEMPSHKHDNAISVKASQVSHKHSVWGSTTHGGYGAGIRYNTSVRGFAGAEVNNGGTEYHENFLCGDAAMLAVSPSISVTSSISNANAGGNNAHNNIPPYLAVYMWKRIS